MTADAFPDTVGAARRPTRADLRAVVRASYGGSLTNVVRGRYGRLSALAAVGMAGAVAAWYADAFASRTAPPTSLLWLPFMASFVLLALSWLVLSLAYPAINGFLFVRQTATAASYVLDGATGEPAVLSAIRLRRVPSGLLVENHVAAQPGRGWGRRLRAEVGDHVREVCDRHGWTLHVVAVNRAMAETYSAEFDRLVPVERTWLQRVAGSQPLVRRPRSVTVEPDAPCGSVAEAIGS